MQKICETQTTIEQRIKTALYESDAAKAERLTNALQNIKIVAETYAKESLRLRGKALVQIHKLAIDTLTGG